jgi:PPIC-type PPIASE domain
MKRVVTAIGCVALVVAFAFGIFFLVESGGPDAVTFGDVAISQRYVDDELQVIGESETLRDAVKQAQSSALSTTDGSVTSMVGSGWLSLIVSQKFAAGAVEKQGFQTTDSDRKRGKELAKQSVGSDAIYRSLPGWFQDRLIGRWTPVAVLERELTQNPSAGFLDAIKSRCPSGRYVSHILVESEQEALALKQQLEAGADFAKLAKANSIDQGSAKQGGALGCLDGQSFVEPFATIAATQPIGVVSDPVATQYGSHLLLVSDEPPEAQLEQAAIQTALGQGRGAVVDVNPRYGTWDPNSGRVVAARTPGTPATPPAPAPTG